MEFGRLSPIIDSAKKVVITTHKSPDGDAIGSSLALAHFLKNKNKEVEIIVPDDFPDFLNWMPGTKDICVYDKDVNKAKNFILASDLIFSLDYNALHRIGEIGDLVAANAKAVKVLIDHHRDPDNFADYSFVDIESCSTAQLVYDCIVAIAGEDGINKDIAECIYTGIMTDTGSFRFPSTSAHTHRIAANLIDKGIDIAQIHVKIYDSSSLDRLQLLGYALNNKLKVFPEYKTALISLSSDELRQFNAQKGDTEGLVNYPLGIKGINVSVLIMEKDGKVKMSFRSQGDFSVNDFARNNFIGGGHKNAAGAISDLSFKDTIKKVEQLFVKYAKELNRS